MSAGDAGPVLREITPDDVPGVGDLERRVGFPPTADSYWQQLWANPVLEANRGTVSAGWVLEDDGRIVGHFGNIPMLFAYGEETLMTASAKGVAVDPFYQGRKLGARLCAAFFEQDNVDLLLSTTTNARAGAVFRKFGAHPVPQPGYDTALYRMLRARRFLEAGLRKKGLGAVARPGGWLGAPLLALDRVVRGRGPRRPAGGGDTRVLGVGEIGCEFDDLWRRKRAEAARLLAFRTSDLLRWHFRKPANERSTRIGVLRRGGRLAGYVIVALVQVRNIDLRRARIVDLIAERDDPDAVDALLWTADEIAHELGGDILEMMGFPKSIRDRFLLGNPHRRTLPCRPYIYKAVRESLRATCESGEAWYACPFDGDASLRGDE